MVDWDKIKILLDILNMNEVEQWAFLISQQKIQEINQSQLDTYCQPKYKRRVLADTAFKIRDEVIKAGCDWLEAVCEVIKYCVGEKRCEACGQNHKTKKYFNWSDDAQPVHWIIAALIAEVMKEEVN